MFTGIIETIGTVKSLSLKTGTARLEIHTPWSHLSTGESVNVDGACLTVASALKNVFAADVSPESLRRTIIGGYRPGRRVNLERALKLGDRLGGHLVYGHVDGVGKINRIIKRSEHWDIELWADQEWRKYIADKCSVAINGISLTVAEKLSTGFRLAVVPHTLSATTIGSWRAGDRVNIETDMAAKYLEALIKAR
jgi:riboflavin synthase